MRHERGRLRCRTGNEAPENDGLNVPLLPLIDILGLSFPVLHFQSTPSHRDFTIRLSKDTGL